MAGKQVKVHICPKCQKPVSNEKNEYTTIKGVHYHSACGNEIKEQKELERIVQCHFCKEKLKKGDSQKFRGVYYHPDCIIKEQELKEEQKAQIRAERYLDDKDELIDYLFEKIGFDSVINGKVRRCLHNFVWKQINDFPQEYGYTYKGMLLTLKYFHETLGNPWTPETIGIIPYAYEDAKNFYIVKCDAEEHLEKIGEYLTVKRVIKMQPPERRKRENDELIDMDSLL